MGRFLNWQRNSIDLATCDGWTMHQSIFVPYDSAQVIS